MKMSSLKELLIFTLWILTVFISIFLSKNGYSVQWFYLAVVVLFETYVYFQLPYSEYFWNAAQHAEDPCHGKIRLAVMACLVVFLVFVLKWNYFPELYFIATIRVDGIINFFRSSKEERHRILETDGLSELKSYLYMLVWIPIAFVAFVVVYAWFFIVPAFK